MCSPTVIIEDGDLHDTGSAELALVPVIPGQQGQLQEELLVGLPLGGTTSKYFCSSVNIFRSHLVIVHDRDPDLLLGLVGCEGEHLVHCLVVLALHGAAVDGLDPDLDGVAEPPVAAHQHAERADVLHHGRGRCKEQQTEIKRLLGIMRAEARGKY